MEIIGEEVVNQTENESHYEKSRTTEVEERDETICFVK
jgi:hypothetical protein